MRKLFSKWQPRLFTVDQKQQRVDGSERCLELFQYNKKVLFMWYGKVFWDALSILFIDYLEKGKTTNSEYYIVLLVRLKEEIAKNDPK